MSYRFASLFAILLLTMTASATAGTVNVRATYEVGGIAIDIGIWDDHLTLGPDWTSVVLYRQSMGPDSETIALNGGDPFAWPIDDREYATIEYMDPAFEPNRGYRYFARVRDAEGNEFVESGGGLPGDDFEGCGAFAIGRGVLNYDIYESYGYTYVHAYLDPVCDGTWSQTSFCPDLDLEEFFARWYPYVGQTLELRGRYDYYGMPVECHWAIDEIVPIANCSGQVSTVSTSWGAIKQMYD